MEMVSSAKNCKCFLFLTHSHTCTYALLLCVAVIQTWFTLNIGKQRKHLLTGFQSVGVISHDDRIRVSSTLTFRLDEYFLIPFFEGLMLESLSTTLRN